MTAVRAFLQDMKSFIRPERPEGQRKEESDQKKRGGRSRIN